MNLLFNRLNKTHRHFPLCWMIVFLFLSTCPYATAQDTAYQCDGTIGRDFWLMFLDNRGDQTPHQTLLNIIGDTSATINVFNPSTNWSTSATLNAFQSVQISVPTSSSSCTQSNTMQTKNFGLHVTSTTSVSVTATNHKLKCNDMALIYPTHMLGTHYIMQDFPGSSQHSDISNAVVGFVATRDNTTLTMVLPCNLIGNFVHSGDTLTVNLMQGQSYQLIASPSSSFSGMEVTSNGKPFAAFQGNRAAYIPTAAQGADLLYEQAVPVEHWGTDYVVVPTYGRSGDQVRITSAEDNCQLYRDGTLLATLQKGDTYEESINATKRYTATGKIAVGRYLHSNSSGGSPGDPASTMIPPADQGSQHIRFSTRTESEFSNHYVNIVAPNSCVPGITLDGSNIANRFQQLDTTYSYATVPLSQGTHSLDSPQGSVVADLYGLGNVAGYATLLAYSICRQPEPESLCNGQGRDFWATFLCNDDDPANSALSLIATGAQQASVTVTNPVTGWTQTASMPAGGKVQINLPVASTIPSGQTHNIGYHITSTAPVTLYACNFKEGSWDFAQVFPTFAIGDNYIVQNYTNNSDHPANVAFVATENGTSLSMVLPCTVTGLSLPAGSQYTATLDSGQSLMLRANPGGDFSGMEVSSNCKPFALFQGCAAGRVGDNGTNSGRDHFFEQALSPAMWGTEFVADASLNRSEGDRVVVTAGADNCTVQINGSIVATLMRGQSHEHTLASNTTAHIITSQPAYACLYLVSYHNGGTRGDPGAATLPPVNRWVCHSDFMLHQCNNNPSSQYYIANPYINIIAENTAVGTLALDGTVIPASLFSPIAGTSFSHTRKNIDYGAHTLDGGDAGTFSARAYGLGQWVGFTYNIDMLVDTMERCLPQLHHDTITYSDSVCMGLSYLSPMEIVCGNTTYLPPSGLIYVPSSETAQPGTLQRESNWVQDDTVHHIHLTLTILASTHDTLTSNLIAGDTLLFADTAITLAGTYTFRYTAQNGCDSVVTLIVGYEAAGLTASADGLCPGEEVTLTATGTHTFIWSAAPADPSLDALQGQNPVSVHPVQTTTYSLLDAAGNTIASITVGVEPPPALCIESNRSFIDFDHPVLSLHDCSVGRHHTSWSFSDGATLHGERARRLFHHPLPDSVSVTMTSCNNVGCCADTTVAFATKIRSVWFPNIFFPDQADNNRFGCHTSFEVNDFEIHIYNRHGLLVWHSDDINVPWDGTHDGTPVPQGAYVYRWYLTDIYGDRRNGIGTVTLIR